MLTLTTVAIITATTEAAAILIGPCSLALRLETSKLVLYISWIWVLLQQQQKKIIYPTVLSWYPPFSLPTNFFSIEKYRLVLASLPLQHHCRKQSHLLRKVRGGRVAATSIRPFSQLMLLQAEVRTLDQTMLPSWTSCTARYSSPRLTTIPAVFQR